MTYSEKLKDPRWQRLRLEIMERDGFACRRCQSETETLHVHHAFYAKGRAPWEYEPADLITLCHECHEVTEAERVELLKVGRSPSSWKTLIQIARILANPDAGTINLAWAVEDVARIASIHADHAKGIVEPVELCDEARCAAGDITANVYRYALNPLATEESIA